MENSRRNESKMAELVSVAVKPGTILYIQVKGEKGLTSYIGPVERMDRDSMAFVSGGYELRDGVPVQKKDSDRIQIYGSEIVDYSVMGSILGCAVPKFKRNY